jgi:hypothetical protein
MNGKKYPDSHGTSFVRFTIVNEQMSQESEHLGSRSHDVTSLAMSAAL